MFLKTGLKNGNLKIAPVDFQGSDKPGKNRVLWGTQGKLGKLREF